MSRPRPNRPPPYEQLRGYLAVARRQDVEFEVAWPAALNRTLFAHDRTKRQTERSALDETQWAWRLAYAGLDVPGGPALIALGDAIRDADDEHQPHPVRVPIGDPRLSAQHRDAVKATTRGRERVRKAAARRAA